MAEFVPVPGYRSRVESIPGGIELWIPSRRNFFVAVFILIWLCFWFFGAVSAGNQLLHPHPLKDGTAGAPDSFLIVWLTMWMCGGVFAIAMALWNLAGRERVIVQNDRFSIRREAFGIGYGKHYEMSAVKDVRVVESAVNSGYFGMRSRDPFGIMGGPLAFDYGAKTVYFGAGIDAAEAKYLLSRLRAAKPTLTSRN